MLLLLSFFGFFGFSTEANSFQPLSTNDSLKVIEVLGKWKKDSTSCLKIRNYKLADFIIDNVHFIGKSESEVIKILGNPNKRTIDCFFLYAVREDDEFIRLKYYFDALCFNGKPEENNDGLCWLEITISPRTNKVVSIDKACT